MSNLPPAGWNPDPKNPAQLRWWDGSAWTEHTAPKPSTAAPAPRPQADPGAMKPLVATRGPVRPWYARWWVIAAGSFAVLFVIASVIGGSTSSDPSGSSEPVAASAASEAPPTTEATPSAEEVAAQEAEEAQAAAEEQARAAAEAKRQRKAERAARRAERARLDPSTYETISARQWSVIVKNPDAHVGEKIVLHGYVTQFDAATGTEDFLANTSAERKSDWYEYDENTLVAAAESDLFDSVVEDDMVTLYVEVTGSETYDTQIGGSTTVPSVTANIVEVTGSTA